MRAFIFGCLLSVAGCLEAQLAVAPIQGSETGGDAVTISGLSCIDCSAAVIRFAGTPAQKVTAINAGVVQAITPSHAPGAVDITTDDGTITKGFTYVQAGTFIASNFEAVLIPLSLGANQFPGGYGSLWASELWINNGNRWTAELLFGNPDNNSGSSPVIIQGQTRNGQYIASAQSAFGLLAWVQKGSAKGFTFELQARDVSRAKLHSGTEMPVVHESEFKDSIDLLNVPIEPASSRIALRVFNLDSSREFPVHVVITPAAGGEALVDDETLIVRGGPGGGTVRSYARYGSDDDLVARYPQLANAGRVHITVSTTGPEKIWSFVAVTNNATQLITTIMPH